MKGVNHCVRLQYLDFKLISMVASSFHHLESPALLSPWQYPPQADASLQEAANRLYYFGTRGCYSPAETSLPSSHLLPKISKISKIRDCQRQINSDGAYSETSMSIVFISLPMPRRLITSDYIFKETFMHCKHCKNISLQVPISSIWQSLGVSSQLKSLTRTSYLWLRNRE